MSTPLQGAIGKIWNSDWTQEVAEIVTDADGNFTSTFLPNGTYYLEIYCFPQGGAGCEYAGGAYKNGGPGNMTCDSLEATEIVISGSNVTGINVLLRPMPVVPGDCVYV